MRDGCVYRVPKAYPIYDARYADSLNVLKDYCARFDNLYTTGRNGLHRYNNQDHSMLTGLYAVRNLCGEGAHDLWTVNAAQEYLEEAEVPPDGRPERPAQPRSSADPCSQSAG